MLEDHEARCLIAKVKADAASAEFWRIEALPWYKDIFLRKLKKAYKESKRCGNEYLKALKDHAKAIRELIK